MLKKSNLLFLSALLTISILNPLAVHAQAEPAFIPLNSSSSANPAEAQSSNQIIEGVVRQVLAEEQIVVMDHAQQYQKLEIQLKGQSNQNIIVEHGNIPTVHNQTYQV